MKETCFIFCHGFGFDSTFWNPLKIFFSKQNTLFIDLGYFSDTANTIRTLNAILNEAREQHNHINYIGIGHSLGLMKLASSNIPFSHLIGLHGFINFFGFDNQLHSVREREWMSLKKHFLRSPESTLKQFYQRAGVAFDISQKTIKRTILQEDLEVLKQSMILPPMMPSLILGAVDDKIVPPVLIEDNFASNSQVTIEILNQGQHALGFACPELVCQHVMQFVGL
jgi:pimeloyl-[acyl-carrier protein] methyl ester esterase